MTFYAAPTTPGAAVRHTAQELTAKGRAAREEARRANLIADTYYLAADQADNDAERWDRHQPKPAEPELDPAPAPLDRPGVPEACTAAYEWLDTYGRLPAGSNLAHAASLLRDLLTALAWPPAPTEPSLPPIESSPT
jgi:hypothetical protein